MGNRPTGVTSMVSKATLLKAWIAVQRRKGIEPNADTTWAKIRDTWPNLTPEEQEKLFQEVR
jgi:hypothetical protein